MQESSWLGTEPGRCWEEPEKRGEMDHLVWFNTGTKGLKGRKWIKNLRNKIILFLPRTWNSLLNRTEMSVMSFELHLGLTFHSFPPMSSVLVSTDTLGCFPSFFFFSSSFSLIIHCNDFLKRERKNNQTKCNGTKVYQNKAQK